MPACVDPKLRLRVVHWMRDTGQGCRLAAKEFDLPLPRVKGWRRWGLKMGILQAEPPGSTTTATATTATATTATTTEEAPTSTTTATPTPTATATSMASMGRVQFLEQLVAEVNADRLQARSLKHSAAAVENTKMLVRLHEELLHARKLAQEGEDAEDLPEDEYLRRLEDEARDMPDDHLEVLLRVYADRHRGRLLLVTDNHRAELDEEGWRKETA